VCGNNVHKVGKENSKCVEMVVFLKVFFFVIIDLLQYVEEY
jgi:hypothetical protein